MRGVCGPTLLKALGWPSEKDRRGAADARFLDLLASPTTDVELSTFLLDDEAIVSRSIQLDEVASARLSTVPRTLPDRPLLRGVVDQILFGARRADVPLQRELAPDDVLDAAALPVWDVARGIATDVLSAPTSLKTMQNTMIDMKDTISGDFASARKNATYAFVAMLLVDVLALVLK